MYLLVMSPSRAGSYYSSARDLFPSTQKFYFRWKIGKNFATRIFFPYIPAFSEDLALFHSIFSFQKMVQKLAKF
jgi:hypothetical protein